MADRYAARFKAAPASISQYVGRMTSKKQRDAAEEDDWDDADFNSTPVKVVPRAVAMPAVPAVMAPPPPAPTAPVVAAAAPVAATAAAAAVAVPSTAAPRRVSSGTTGTSGDSAPAVSVEAAKPAPSAERHVVPAGSAAAPAVVAVVAPTPAPLPASVPVVVRAPAAATAVVAAVSAPQVVVPTTTIHDGEVATPSPSKQPRVPSMTVDTAVATIRLVRITHTHTCTCLSPGGRACGAVGRSCPYTGTVVNVCRRACG